ncbi:MAG TPA: DNA repair protein RecO [Gemmatimonadales bacterium]|jgi:DNA repair protein RecO (recombination protein O)|nr:DNA repair protein RecO [Gemmatimonadales bacterium]
MPPVGTPAIVLVTIRYGESSKIARLATRELGVQSAIAKGALRPKSRFGAALHLLSEGTATLHLARSGDLHTLTQFDPQHLRVGLGERLDRYATASLLAELMLRLAPASRHPESYDLFRDALAVLEAAPAAAVEPLGLRMLWRLVAVLGFAPALELCARDGAAVPPDTAVCFSPQDGGVLCVRCARDTVGAQLKPEDRADLGALVAASAELPLLDERHLAAHRRLLERYVRHHLAEGAALPALAFWAERGWIAA